MWASKERQGLVDGFGGGKQGSDLGLQGWWHFSLQREEQTKGMVRSTWNCGFVTHANPKGLGGSRCM